MSSCFDWRSILSCRDHYRVDVGRPKLIEGLESNSTAHAALCALVESFLAPPLARPSTSEAIDRLIAISKVGSPVTSFPSLKSSLSPTRLLDTKLSQEPELCRFDTSDANTGGTSTLLAPEECAYSYALSRVPRFHYLPQSEQMRRAAVIQRKVRASLPVTDLSSAF